MEFLQELSERASAVWVQEHEADSRERAGTWFIR